MNTPSTSWEQIGDHARGSLVAVSFSGVYPPGSAGNEFARAMVEFLRSTLAETRASGVVLDLTALEYAFGDAICELAMALLVEGKSFRPCAIVATGGTARALEPLLAPNFLMGVAGLKLVQTREEAVAHVEQALARGALRTIDAESKRTSVRPASTVKPDVIANLQHSERSVRERSAQELVLCEDRALLSRAFDLLIIATEDPSQTVRRNIAVALRNTEDARALPALIRLLSDKNQEVQRSAATQLGLFGDPRAISPLLETFEATPHLFVREQILDTLGILGHPTGALKAKIDVFNPIDLVVNWIEDTPLMGPSTAAIRTALAANFRREGATASDHLAEMIQQLFNARSAKIEVALSALSVDVLITPNLKTVLITVVSAQWIDSRAIELVKALLEKPKRMKTAILKTLEVIAANKKLLQEATERVYFGPMVSPDYGFALAIARASSPELFAMLKRAEEQLENGKQSARGGGSEDKERAIAAMNQAEEELTRALKFAEDHPLAV